MVDDIGSTHSCCCFCCSCTCRILEKIYTYRYIHVSDVGKSRGRGVIMKHNVFDAAHHHDREGEGRNEMGSQNVCVLGGGRMGGEKNEIGEIGRRGSMGDVVGVFCWWE